jgi:tetratricopeptide (TPR) repeat protein
MQLLGEKRYSEALEQFRLVEQASPQSPQGPSGQGIALALMGKTQEAIEALKKALTLDPAFWVAQRELGILYWVQGAKDDAARELEPIIKLHPDDGPANVILGQYQFEHKDYSQTLVYLSRVPGQVSADVHLSLIMAEAQLKTGETAQASEALKGLVGRAGLTQDQSFQLAWLLGRANLFKAAIDVFSKLPPDYPDDYRRNYGLALAYFGDGQYDKCIATLKALQGRGTTRPELFGLLGVSEGKSGNTQEAYDAFRQGILSNPSDDQNYVNIATLACEHLNYDLAVQSLTSGIERIPNSHELILSRGIAFTLKAQFSLAKQDFERAIQMAPDDPGNYTALGLSQLEAGELDNAVKSFEEASRRGPKEPRAYFFLAEALIQKGVTPGTAVFDQARRATDTAISLDPDFAFAYVDRAKLELKAKETDKAIADLEHARAANPKSSSITYLLAQAYQRNGEKKKADELFAQVRESSDQDAQEFRRNSLTDALVVISKGDH